MSAIVEIIKMKMRPGVSESDVTRESLRADAMFRGIKGLGRRMLMGPDAKGVWSDLCEYDSKRSLDAAHALVKKQPGEAAGYFGLVDMASVSSEQLEVRSCSENSESSSESSDEESEERSEDSESGEARGAAAAGASTRTSSPRRGAKSAGAASQERPKRATSAKRK